MRKVIFICLALILMIPGFTACDAQPTIPVTDISKIMDKIPYSFLEKYNIYYGDLGQAREFYKSDIKSISGLMNATEEQRGNFQKAWSAVAITYPGWSFQSQWLQGGLTTLTGFEEFSFDRAVLITSGPPALSWVAEGTFDTALIKSKLTEQGYTQQNYGKFDYMASGEDFSPQINNQLGRVAMSALDRVAPLDANTLITAPATSFVTAVIDTMDSKTPSIMDNEACKALVKSMGQPLMAAISLPDKLIVSAPNADNRKLFDFPIPEDWGQLKGYSMGAVDYRADAESYYIDIALYYTDKASATDDAETIMTRMRHYKLNTWITAGDRPDFTSVFDPITNVSKSGNGYVLGITCRFISSDKYGGTMYIGGNGLPVRDLLFLAINPEEYVK